MHVLDGRVSCRVRGVSRVEIAPFSGDRVVSNTAHPANSFLGPGINIRELRKRLYRIWVLFEPPRQLLLHKRHRVFR